MTIAVENGTHISARIYYLGSQLLKIIRGKQMISQTIVHTNDVHLTLQEMIARTSVLQEVLMKLTRSPPKQTYSSTLEIYEAYEAFLKQLKRVSFCNMRLSSSENAKRVHSLTYPECVFTTNTVNTLTANSDPIPQDELHSIGTAVLSEVGSTDLFVGYEPQNPQGLKRLYIKHKKDARCVDVHYQYVSIYWSVIATFGNLVNTYARIIDTEFAKERREYRKHNIITFEIPPTKPLTARFVNNVIDIQLPRIGRGLKRTTMWLHTNRVVIAGCLAAQLALTLLALSW